MNNRNDIWVFAEQRDGDLHEVSLELLGKAQEMADASGSGVAAALLGHEIEPMASELIAYGADIVYVADSPEFRSYRLLPFTIAMEHLVKAHDPAILLFGATAMGMELAPRVAARLSTGLSAHCIDLRIDGEGRLLQVVPGWGGGVIATITCPEHRPQMATVMPGAMRAREPGDREGKVKKVPVVLPDTDLGPEVLSSHKDAPRGLPLEKADIVVAGGWGIGSKENWEELKKLANVLDAAVGATRPPVDEGWAEEGQMIGQSGKTVRPKLYIGIGISGVMHHVVGMDQAQHVIAINSDPGADIFEVSDVIVVEDFRKIIPKLIQEISARST
jgi:electron transfer flavoprotein alpha subunit